MVPHVQGIKMTDPLGLSEASAGQETRAGAPDVTVLATDSYLRGPQARTRIPRTARGRSCSSSTTVSG